MEYSALCSYCSNTCTEKLYNMKKNNWCSCRIATPSVSSCSLKNNTFLFLGFFYLNYNFHSNLRYFPKRSKDVFLVNIYFRLSVWHSERTGILKEQGELLCMLSRCMRTVKLFKWKRLINLPLSYLTAAKVNYKACDKDT